MEYNSMNLKKCFYYLSVILLSISFVACSSDDDDNTPPDEGGVIQKAVTNNFYLNGSEAVYFVNTTTADVWLNIENDGEYYTYERCTYKVYNDKQYIVIKTGTKEVQLFYEVTNNKVTIYSDSYKQNVLTGEKKPEIYKEETKSKPVIGEPNTSIIINGKTKPIKKVELTKYESGKNPKIYITTDAGMVTIEFREYNSKIALHTFFKSYGQYNNLVKGRGLYVYDLLFSNNSMTFSDKCLIRVTEASLNHAVIYIDCVAGVPTDGIFMDCKGTIKVEF